MQWFAHFSSAPMLVFVQRNTTHRKDTVLVALLSMPPQTLPQPSWTLLGWSTTSPTVLSTAYLWLERRFPSRVDMDSNHLAALSPLHSAVQMSAWWCIHVSRLSSSSNCSVAECFTEKPCLPGVKCKAISAVRMTGYFAI